LSHPAQIAYAFGLPLSSDPEKKTYRLPLPPGSGLSPPVYDAGDVVNSAPPDEGMGNLSVLSME